MLDALLAAEQLPEEYRDRCQVTKDLSLLALHDTKLITFSMIIPGYPM